MNITNNKVVSIYYSVKDDDGIIVDSNAGYEPLEYLQGTGNMLQALEEGLEGAGINEIRSVTLQPAQAYGDYDNDLVVTVDKTTLGTGAAELMPGMIFNYPDGGEAEVISVLPGTVILNKNHPLAGKQLHFTIKVEGIRNATDQELLSGFPLQAAASCGPSCSCHK